MMQLFQADTKVLYIENILTLITDIMNYMSLLQISHDKIFYINTYIYIYFFNIHITCNHSLHV